MKIGILSNDGWHYRDLKRAASDQHEIVRLDFGQLSGTIQNDASEVSFQEHHLSNFDCILVRAMPTGSLEQVVARMDLLFRLEKLGVKVINPAKSIEAAVDKYLSLCRLQDAGVPIPTSGVFQTQEPALEFFDHSDSDVVYKPIFGSEGHGISRLTDVESAKRLFDDLVENQKVIYLQKFIINPKNDLRLLVVGEKVFGMSRQNDNDWRKNVSLGGTAKSHEPTDEEKDLAIACAAAVGTCIAGVDILIDRENDYWAIEVNSSPGWKATSQAVGIDIAAEILNFLE